MAPLTPVWTKQDVIKKLDSKKSGIDCKTLFSNVPDNKSDGLQSNDCVMKELIQNECNFDRFTGEFQCIPFKRLFKECKVYNPRRMKKQPQGDSGKPNLSQQSSQAEPDYRIQRIEITNIDTNDGTYTCSKIPESEKSAAQREILGNLEKYHRLGKQ
ncbi:hypothetical protein ACO0QE_003457 [Hanseniaspora vineae]